MNREQFETELSNIWFSIKWKYPNSFVYDWKWQRTPFRVRWIDGIELSKSFEYSIFIWFDKIKCQILEWNTLSIQDINWWDDPSLFIQFNNFDFNNL